MLHKENLAGFAIEVRDEVSRCREKFPENKNVLLALQEELGEVTQAALEGRLDDARKEIIQVAALCFRFWSEGDAQFHGLYDNRWSQPQAAPNPVSTVQRVCEVLGKIVQRIDYWTAGIAYISIDVADTALLNSASDEEFSSALLEAAAVADSECTSLIIYTNHGRVDRVASLQELFGITDIRFWSETTDVEIARDPRTSVDYRLQVPSVESAGGSAPVDNDDNLFATFLDRLASPTYDPAKGVDMSGLLPAYPASDVELTKRAAQLAKRREVLTQAFELAWDHCLAWGVCEVDSKYAYFDLVPLDGNPGDVISVLVPNCGTEQEKIATAKPLLLSKFMEARLDGTRNG